MEDIAALIVAIVCGFTGLLGIFALNKDVTQRNFLIRLFIAAFMLRLVFTFFFYAFGLVNILGGADDTGWAGMWARSRSWSISGPESAWSSVYGPGIAPNSGWQYFGSWFYYLLGMESQQALACLNCFWSALTVVVIYKLVVEFYSKKAAAFVAWIAVFIPNFLIWSALTVKESWVIFFSISTFYIVYQLAKSHNPSRSAICALFAGLLIVLMWGLRFYAAGILISGAVVSFMCWRARRPFVAAALGVTATLLLLGVFNAVGIMRIDLASITEARLNELATFRSAVSSTSQSGTGSGIDLDYDTSTIGGASLQMLVGSTYLLLSPFPWQIRSLSQIAALPDTLLWWWLVFGFIMPGIGDTWRRRPAVLISIMAFILPLVLFYAMMFANVGLAYRQRAQLMPFFLILAAAGYDKRRQKSNRRRAHQRTSNNVESQVDTTTSRHFVSIRAMCRESSRASDTAT